MSRAVFQVTQPSGTTVLVAQSPPPDNMMLSVLACLFCFCPIGMFAIMYSCQVRTIYLVASRGRWKHSYLVTSRDS